MSTNSLQPALIVAAVRTPTGKFLGKLSSVSAIELGAHAVREALRRCAVDPAAVDECIMGNVLQAGLGQNPARQVALSAALPDTVPAVTINKVCGSGLKSVALAAQAVQTGDAEIIVAGGTESMSNAPYLLTKARNGYRMGDGQLVDSMLRDGLWDAYNNYHMGITAENIAQRVSISREEQDAHAAESHRRAVLAREAGFFRQQIVSIPIAGTRREERVEIDADESIRADTTLEILARLKPAFKHDGTVTAGNASGLSDGASALVVMSAQRAVRLGVTPFASIRGQASSGVDPAYMGLAPVSGIRKLLAKVGWTIQDVDLFELNEAFSAQALAVMRELGTDPSKVNVNGGAVALGHPIGASGARVLTTLIYALMDRGLRRGVAALCIGGGNSIALAIERE